MELIFTREIQQILADLKVPVVDPEEIDRRADEVKKRFVELFGA